MRRARPDAAPAGRRTSVISNHLCVTGLGLVTPLGHTLHEVDGSSYLELKAVDSRR